jgi:sodium transport system permease protein
MRWSIIRIIFLRELRDQLRDRRTIFMIVILPILLYPVLGLAFAQFTVAVGDKPNIIGIVGTEQLPRLQPTSYLFSPLAQTAWLTCAPGLDSSLGRAAGAVFLSRAAAARTDYPPLIIGDQFAAAYFDRAEGVENLRVLRLPDAGRGPLEAKQIDLMVIVPDNFLATLQENGVPTIRVDYRDKDDRSALALQRVTGVLMRWKQKLRQVRFLRLGQPAGVDDPFVLENPEQRKRPEELASEGIFDLLVRIFPFLLVMWSLAGALYPAVDLCAGEKERGTMETLLISPASRDEVVWGKFLTIWLFSAATALLNLGSMGLTASQFSAFLSRDMLSPLAVLWCVVLVLPLSAFFSALCLALGAYARSSKEGQYYLMPLFVITLPLIFLTLAPGVELNPFYSLVPVTGVALLMQRLMTSPVDQVPWIYFLPVLAPIVLYGWLALRWAIEQFKREEVLFREAERLEIRLWLRRLLREKEPLPSAGQALFCFALIVASRWLGSVLSAEKPLLVSAGISYLAFVVTPPLLMALVLTTRPLEGLRLKLPGHRSVLLAALLAGLMLPPIAKATSYVLERIPNLDRLLNDRQPMIEELLSLGSDRGPALWSYFLVLSILPAAAEELAFRGFILTGLRRRLSPWGAILISSFLFALYHLNVFQAGPALVLGLVLGMLATRSDSVFPGMLFNMLYKGLLIGVPLLQRAGYFEHDFPFQHLIHPALTIGYGALALWLLFLLALRLRIQFQGPAGVSESPVSRD